MTRAGNDRSPDRFERLTVAGTGFAGRSHLSKGPVRARRLSDLARCGLIRSKQ
jgi:hypothetical protein